MRRGDREVREFSDILAIIERCDVCRLALNDAEYPYIVPLNFGVKVTDSGTVELYFHGACAGTKIDLIAKDNRASFEMDCGHNLLADTESGVCTMEYQSVIGRGHIEIVPDEEKYEALSILMKHYYADPFPINKAVTQKTAVFKLVVESMTGKTRRKRNPSA